MNKKGNVVFNGLMWIIKIIFLVAVLFSLVFLVRSFIVTELDIFNAETDIFVQRILLSRNGVSYIDEDLDRLYPGIVDMDKFLSPDFEDILNHSIYFGEVNKKIASNITLLDEDGDTIRTVIYNPEYFFRWKEMLEAQWLRGPGGVGGKKKQFQVLIKSADSADLRPGLLIVEVVIPNS